MIKRALIAGLGSIGQRHLRLLKARIPEARIMALRHSPHVEPIDGVEICTNNLADAIAFKPEIAIIATPAPFHAGPAIELAQRGTHLLVEKPMAASLDDAIKLAAAASKAGIVLQIGYNLRFLRSLGALREALHAGQIGRVASIRAEVGQYLPSWRPGTDWRNAVSARADLGGGALLELSHELDYLRWIFGEVTAVRGWMGTLGGLGIAVEDTVHLVLEFSSSFPKNALGSAPVAAVSLDFIRRDTVRRCTVIGESGTLIWDAISSQVRLIRPGAMDQLLYDSPPVRDDSYTTQLDSFLHCVESKTPPVVSGDDGVAVMRIIEAVRSSNGNAGISVTPALFL